MYLKLISANIRFDNPNDGDHTWEHRRPHLQKIIQDFLPDILATQEGRKPQLKNLESLIHHTLIDAHRDWISDRMYPCLFINEEQIKLNLSGDVWLSETPYVNGSSSFNSAFPRLCTWAQVTHLTSGEDFFVINTHLDHVLEETRVEQIKVLINEVQVHNKKNHPVILMGDFNASPFGEVRKTINEKMDLKDPWFEKQLAEETSHHGFIGSDKGDRIDWILVPKAFVIEEIKMEKNAINKIYPSDHYPILATVVPR
jgi:endonuclease/exonuclease/phosphatase family metal-dependent hydrolase